MYRVDTSSDAVTVNGSSLSFSIPVAAAILYGRDYRIQVDVGAVKSAQNCDVRIPTGADWRFRRTGKFDKKLGLALNTC